MNLALLIALGLGAGVLAGMFGIGGGLVIVPGLVILLKMDPKTAAGTSLAALVLPTGLLGAYEYYREGFMDIRAAVVVALGLFIGAFFGAKLVVGLDPLLAKRLYACFLFAMGARLLFSTK
jgi:uncharacterized membrane protein YfcA